MTHGSPKVIGPYEVLRELGSGGMGVVYLAKTSTASKVAVKVVQRNLARDPEIRARFMGEVDHLRMAFGARVARFEDADLEADEPWLAVEYVPGLTLREHLEQHDVLAPKFGAILGAVLAEGVESIHKAGLVHRDLKPQNIILSAHGPVIIDFGLAMLVDREEHLTQAGHAVGTPLYMSPEQAAGQVELTGKADIYALGGTLVTAIAGHNLYPGSAGQQLIWRILDPNDHPDISGIPADLAALVGSMVAYEDADRPTATQVKDTLLSVVGRGGKTAASLRNELQALTWKDTTPSLPPDADDPIADPESGIEDIPTVLVPKPPLPKPVPAVAIADVSRLVTRMRAQYGREGSL